MIEKIISQNKPGANMDLIVNRLEDKSVIIMQKKNILGSEAAEFQNTVLDLIEEGSKSISVDLSQVKYVTSWGIGILIHAHTTCLNKEIDFHLSNVDVKIMDILKKVKLDTIFKIK